MLGEIRTFISQSFSTLENWWQANHKVVQPSDYIPVLDIGGFLTILTFSVAIFTLTSPKFQLRLSTALVPVRSVFFFVLVASGLVILLIEAVILYELPIPVFIDPSKISLFIAACITVSIIYWMTICFLRPPKYGRFTARRFFVQAFRCIANGTKEEMLALAQELVREIPRILACSPAQPRRLMENDGKVKPTELEAMTHNLLLLLSDSRFCNLVAKELPSFAAYLVEKMVETERFEAPAHLIVRRIVIALLSDHESALFVENEWLAQGYIGEVKPITRSIFFNWHKIEQYERGLESPLDLDYPHARNWDTETWRVYFGAARQYLNGLVTNEYRAADPRGLGHILRTTERAYSEIGSVEKMKITFDPHNPYWHAKEANEFLVELVKIFDVAGERVYFDRRDRYGYGRDLSSAIARVFMEAIFSASQINTKEFRMWDIQHNLVWHAVESHEVQNTPIMRMARRKLRRLIWDEIKQMDKFPNYRAAAYIRFCLNVLGFYEEPAHRRDSLGRDSRPLTKVVSAWVRRNYMDLTKTHPPVAEAFLPANIEFDHVAQVLIQTRNDTLTGVPHTKKFKLDARSAFEQA